MQQHRVLLTGASGFVGRAIYNALLDRGERLVCPSRSPLDWLAPDVANPQTGELSPTTDWSPHLQGVDVVIHCAARVHVMHETTAHPLALFRLVNVAATVQLAEQAAQAGVKQFIYLSSVKVNGDGTQLGHPYSEASAPAATDPYGVSKYEAEQALLALGERTGLRVTIIRPPLIYGPGVKANFASMLQWVRKGVPLPFGRIRNKRSLVYLGNLVSLILCCMHHPQAAQQIFLVSDNHDLSTPELLQLSAQAMNTQARLLPFPPRLLILLATLVGKQAVSDRLCGSLQVDIRKAQQLLGWTPPYSVEEGLRATVEALHTPAQLKIVAS